MTNSQEFPQLAERLSMEPSKNRLKRLHEFATDLATGFDEGAWDTRLIYDRAGGKVIVWRIGGADSNQEMLSALQSKWAGENLPDFEAMHSQGYFEELPGKAYKLSAKTLQLA